MRTLLRVLICVVLAGIAAPAMAQTNTDTYFGTPGGGGVNGSVGMCLSALNQAVPCSDPRALPSPVSGTFAATPAVGITPTDHTITSASGASQQIMAANTTRHSLTIENTGNANCGVNPTGGTAVIGGAGTITLAPLGAWTPSTPTLSAVTIICTAGQPIYGSDS
jgi:hypothetical protein